MDKRLTFNSVCGGIDKAHTRHHLRSHRHEKINEEWFGKVPGNSSAGGRGVLVIARDLRSRDLYVQQQPRLFFQAMHGSPQRHRQGR